MVCRPQHAWQAGLALGGLEVPGSARHRLQYLGLPSPPEAQAVPSLVTLNFH